MKKLLLLLSILISTFGFSQKTNNELLPFGVNLAGAEFGHGSPIPGIIDVHYFYPTVQDQKDLLCFGFHLSGSAFNMR